MILLALMFALVSAGALAALDPGLAAQGWHSVAFRDRAALRVEPAGDGVIRLHGTSGIALAYRPMRVPVDPATCLSWRWRVDAAPPPTDIAASAGADRALSLWVGFEDDGERMSLMQRYSLGMARMMSGGRAVPGFILLYTHGGTGRERDWHRAPHLGGLGRTLALHPAGTAMGEWVAHEVPLSAHFRAAFGIAPTGHVTELAISADSDDTATAIDARIADLRFGACSAG